MIGVLHTFFDVAKKEGRVSCPGRILIKIAKTSQTLFCRSPVEVQSNEPEHSVPKKRRTLMDLDQEESLWPWAKNAEQIPTLKSYIQKFLCD